MFKILKRYKQNTISRDLHRSRKIASNFDIKIRAIKAKYSKAGYPQRFIESVIRDVTTPFVIPPFVNRLLFHQYVHSKETISTVRNTVL